MCGKRADCEDKHCPGRLYAEDGGESVDYPIATPEDAELWYGLLSLVAISCGVAVIAWLVYTIVPILSSLAPFVY